MNSKFINYIEELRNNNADTLEKYENFCGKVEGDFKNQIWYTDYAIAFESCVQPCEVNKEAEVTEEEYDFLKILIMASFSSSYKYIFDERYKMTRMQITVTSNNQRVVKFLDDLYIYQINRLFEIYIKEQMELQIHYEEGKIDDKIEISNVRTEKIEYSKNAFEKVDFYEYIENQLYFEDFKKIIPLYVN